MKDRRKPKTTPDPGEATLLIGTWRYEGPLLEDLTDIAEKGTDCAIQISWRRILNKNAVEYNWSVEFGEGSDLSGKALIGWNADKKEIVYGSMNSAGVINMGTVTPDSATKTINLTSKGINSKGEETSFKGVVTKTGKDTLTWQALERTGGIVEGPSPVYTFTRVERAKKAAK